MAIFKLPLVSKIYKSSISMESFTLRGYLMTDDSSAFHEIIGKNPDGKSYERGYNLPTIQGVPRWQHRQFIRDNATRYSSNRYSYVHPYLPYSQSYEDFVACLRLEIEGDSPFGAEAQKIILRLFEQDFCRVAGLEKRIRLKELWNDDYFKGIITELFDKSVIKFEELFEELSDGNKI